MSNRTCAVDECSNEYYCRGWCQMHYRRWLKDGSPGQLEPLRKRRSQGWPVKRIQSCLVWQGSLDTHGYGKIEVHGKTWLVHRYIFTQSNGEIPPGMLVDHLCHTRACVEPSHLRLATRQQNNANRAGATRLSSTGVRGVYPHGDRFKVGIRSNGTLRWYGKYDSLDEAAQVADRERARIFGAFAGQG